MTKEEAIKIIEAEYGEYLYAYSPEETTADTRYVFERKTLFNRELIKTAKELTRA